MSEYLLGKYQIISKEKDNYKCILQSSKREEYYSILCIKKENIDELDAIMFKKLENLNHKSILNFHIEQNDKYYYLIREELEEYNIISDSSINKLSKSYFLCFLQICNALSYLHEKEMSHGCLDYKSIYVNNFEIYGNDVEESDIKSYLLDVGFSYINILNPKPSIFSSPEQRNNNIPYSIKSDIYSLAQIMLNIVYSNSGNEIIYTEDMIHKLLLDVKEHYKKQLLNLFLNMIQDEPDKRYTISKVSEKLNYCYRLYVNENNDYVHTIGLKFTKKSEAEFEEEFKINEDFDKPKKIEELARDGIFFKETKYNYIIILSNYVFYCSKNKFGEGLHFLKLPCYFLVVSLKQVSDNDYRDAINITDSIFEYFNSNNIANYTNPKDFVNKCNNKKQENCKDHIDIKQEDALLTSTKNIIDHKKVYYKCIVDGVDKADNQLIFRINNDEKFIIRDKKKVSSILKKYIKDEIQYNDLAAYITANMDEILSYSESYTTQTGSNKNEQICSLFENAVECKENIEMVLRPDNDVIISNDNGKEYSGNIIKYNSNDKTVSIKVCEEIYKNFVIGDKYNICYDYQIKEMIWKKQSQAFEDLKLGVSHIDGLMNKIINPEKYLSTYDKLADIDMYYNSNLDDNQKEAVKKALNLHPNAEILLIQGPPGTGKTTVIVEIIKQYLVNNSQNKILVASQSNQALDNVLEKVCDEHKVLRIGNDKNKMSEIAKKYAVSEVLNTLCQKNIEKINKLKSTSKYQDDYKNILLNISDKLKNDSKKMSDKVIDYFLSPIRVIFATLIGISGWKNFRDIVFDVVIIDEAGRALISELAVPIRKAKYIILVGDQKQLAPVMDDEVIEDIENTVKKNQDNTEYWDKANYKEDLLNYNFFGGFYDRLSNHPNATHFLEYNYRAHSTICELYSKVFYECKLKSHTELDNNKQHGLSIYKSSVVLLDTSKSKRRYEKQLGNGKINDYNADIIECELKSIIKNIKENKLTNKTIGIITPYRAQKNKLSKKLKNIIDVDENVTIDIGTVDSFQGSDRDYIIYDSVRSSEKIGNIKFISDEKRLNVSLSRAKELLIIVADSKFLQVAGKGNSKWIDILNIIQNNPNVYETIYKGDL